MTEDNKGNPEEAKSPAPSPLPLATPPIAYRLSGHNPMCLHLEGHPEHEELALPTRAQTCY